MRCAASLKPRQYETLAFILCDSDVSLPLLRMEVKSRVGLLFASYACAGPMTTEEKRQVTSSYETGYRSQGLANLLALLEW